LQDVVPDLPRGTSSCKAAGDPRPTACCGAAEPLCRHHPADAERVGAFWLRRWDGDRIADARCRDHLSRLGRTVRDPLDALLEER
jgi:hypothetical protein